MLTPYQPLSGVRVLDMGKLLPPAETTLLLAGLGADVVKVELPGVGDSLRDIGVEGDSPFHRSMSVGKRSIALDLRTDGGRSVFFELADVADVIVENALAGRWAEMGIDFAAMRHRRPELIICSITGFGQTGPLASLNSHGLNMDALAGVLPVEWADGQPHLGATVCSWANELGSTHAALAICAALLERRSSGQGAWIDISCWDAAVGVHRASLVDQAPAGEPGERGAPEAAERTRAALYDTYRCADGGLVLLATLEPKFWGRFCERLGRPDLTEEWSGTGQIGFGGNDDAMLRKELEDVFVTATAAEWQRRFLAWDIPGGQVVAPGELAQLEHFQARGLRQRARDASSPGDGSYLATAIRWHDHDQRAGAGLAPPPALDQHRREVLRDWLGH